MHPSFSFTCNDECAWHGRMFYWYITQTFLMTYLYMWAGTWSGSKEFRQEMKSLALRNSWATLPILCDPTLPYKASPILAPISHMPLATEGPQALELKRERSELWRPLRCHLVLVFQLTYDLIAGLVVRWQLFKEPQSCWHSRDERPALLMRVQFPSHPPWTVSSLKLPERTTHKWRLYFVCLVPSLKERKIEVEIT